MLKCKDIAHNASDYLAAEMPWFKKLPWHLHLFVCHKCRAFVDQFKLTILTVTRIEPKPLPDDKVERIVTQVLNQSRSEQLGEQSDGPLSPPK